MIDEDTKTIGWMTVFWVILIAFAELSGAIATGIIFGTGIGFLVAAVLLLVDSIVVFSTLKALVRKAKQEADQ